LIIQVMDVHTSGRSMEIVYRGIRLTLAISRLKHHLAQVTQVSLEDSSKRSHFLWLWYCVYFI